MQDTGTDRQLVIAAKNTIADDVVELVLACQDGARPGPWEPGAHVTVQLPGVGQRQYSLCGRDRSDERWTIAVHRAPDSRGGSRFIHDELDVGSSLPVHGPANTFPLEQHDNYVLVAGGIGITPILSMARELRARGATFTMLYCARSRSLMAYREEIASWHDRSVTLHVDDEQGGPPDIGAFLAEHAGAAVYCCGPEPLIAAVENKAPPSSAVRTERFRAVEADHADNEAFDVVISGSGERVRVGENETILDALARSGFDVPFSCREGICGTCETAVVSGEPEHRDSVLSADERAEGALIMPCVSRSRTPEIELDLF